jgi:hypothetical protein
MSERSAFKSVCCLLPGEVRVMASTHFLKGGKVRQFVHPRQRMYAGDERDEDIPEAERLFTRLCGDLSPARGASPLSADHDAFRMKSKSASRGPGLSLKSNPKKAWVRFRPLFGTP